MSAPLPRRILDARGDISRLNEMATNTSYDTFNFLKELRDQIISGVITATTDALLTAIQSLLTTLNSIVSTAANQTSANTKLDTLHTDLAQLHTDVGTAAFKTGQVTGIGTAADVNFSSQALVKGIRVKNISTGGQSLYVSHAATPTSTTSLVLLPGEWSNHLDVTNANQVYMRASAASGAACYDGA